jgi:hypothetical protein
MIITDKNTPFIVVALKWVVLSVSPSVRQSFEMSKKIPSSTWACHPSGKSSNKVIIGDSHFALPCDVFEEVVNFILLIITPFAGYMTDPRFEIQSPSEIPFQSLQS